MIDDMMDLPDDDEETIARREQRQRIVLTQEEKDEVSYAVQLALHGQELDR